MPIPPQILAQERSRTAPEGTLLSPIGGWNTRETISSMPPEDASILDNWLPGTADLTSRPGFSSWATGFGSLDVETLLWYKYGATSTLFGAAGTVIYSIPSTSGGTSTSVLTGLTNARWQWINFAGYLHLVNGADAPRNYNGSFATPSFSGDISGLEATMDGVHHHGNRLYLWSTAGTKFFYGGTNAVSGAFTAFDTARVSHTGGNIMIMQSLTLDSGSGSDDLAVFILDTGETLIYNGSDPSSASTFALVGRFHIPPPISVRSAIKFRGDVLVATESDIVALLKATKDAVDDKAFILGPSKLSGAVQDAFRLYGDNYGWQMQAYGKQRWIILNVPSVENDTYYQYVVNTITGAATRFTGINARCWGLWKNSLYFGGDGVVYLADDGLDDAGADIELVAQQAPTNFKIPQDKRFFGYEMYIQAEGDLEISTGFSIDYGTVLIPAASTSGAPGPEWDEEDWDVPDWSGAAPFRTSKHFPVGIGQNIAGHHKISVNGQQVRWARSNYAFEPLLRR